MAHQPLVDLPAGTRHVIWVVAQGLAAETLDFYSDGHQTDLLIEAPNLKALARSGIVIGDCAGLAEGPMADIIPQLWDSQPTSATGGQEGEPAQKAGLINGAWQEGSPRPARLALQAARHGKLWLSMLPYAGVENMGAAAAVPRCELRVNLQMPAAGDLQWEDLVATNPEVHIDNVSDEGQLEELIQRILARFPGRATQVRGTALAQSPTDAWLEWLGDAFLRSVWYSLARPAGTLAFMYHPGPSLCAAQTGADGYRRGVEALDDLVGRLMMLQEHEQAGGMLLVVTGDYAWPGQTGQTVPVLLFGPGTEPATIYADCTLADVAHLVEASL